jgi:hypothetical protein
MDKSRRLFPTTNATGTNEFQHSSPFCAFLEPRNGDYEDARAAVQFGFALLSRKNCPERHPTSVTDHSFGVCEARQGGVWQLK